MSSLVVGIDPGMRGALVAVEGGEFIASLMMPFSGAMLVDAEVIDWLSELDVALVVLERQQAFPRQGVSSTFTTGFRYGQLYGMISTLRLAMATPRPADWMKVMLEKTDDEDVDPLKGKERAISRVKELLPALNLTPGRHRVDHDGLADAGLLALYGERMLADPRHLGGIRI